MLARLQTYSLFGIDAIPVDVEVDVSSGALPATVLVGMPDTAIRESTHRVARAMVTQYGMTESLGAVKLGDDNAQPFLGRDLGHTRNYSEAVAAKIDEEVNKLLSTAHQEAFDILAENRDVLDELVVQLLEKETLDKAQVAQIFEALRRRDPRPAWTGSDSRPPSSIPPVTYVPNHDLTHDAIDGVSS